LGAEITAHCDYLVKLHYSKCSYSFLVVVCMQSTTTLTNNDIVINKLTQILSYLRQGRRDRKKRKDRGDDFSAD